MIATEEADTMKNAGGLSSFDFASLAPKIKKGTLWRINMQLTNQIDRDGQYHEANKSGVDGLRPVFFLTCSVFGADGWRFSDQCIGIPTSADILK